MHYTVHDWQCVLQNDDWLSYVYFGYDDGYFIIGKDEDIGENDNPRLITLEKRRAAIQHRRAARSRAL